jgi:hypothetical protein
MMAEKTIPFIDRLQERGLIDRLGFLVFAGLGSLAILAAKYSNAPSWTVALGAVGLILLYAIIINIRGTGKLRADQAGDNCYYLGLIYTLTSLSYAIFTFDPNKTATTIVQGFGIALASTIAGLILRVFFNQARVDLFEVEDTARLELAEAASKLKGELSLISLSFKEFSVGLQQSVAEVRDAANENIRESSSKTVATLEILSQELRMTLETQSTELATHGKKVAKGTASVASSLDRHMQALDNLSERLDGVSNSIKQMADASQLMASHSTELLAQTKASRDTQVETLAIISQLERASGNLLSNVDSAAQNMQRWEAEFSSRLVDLTNSPHKTSEAALKVVANAADALSEAMTNLRAIQEDAVKAVTSSTEGLLTIVKDHNTSLEVELGKSRRHVTEVHGSLVDITTKLADLGKPNPR